jgi:hypothetical protein
MDTIKKFVKKATSTHSYTPKIDLDHTQLPESDGTFVKNFQEHPQSLVLTSSIEPVLQKLHPDGQYCIGQDSGIYWKVTKPPEKGAEAPDWFYVPKCTTTAEREIPSFLCNVERVGSTFTSDRICVWEWF